MESIRVAAPPLLAALLLLCGCENTDERLRQQVKQQVAANLAGRDDVTPVDGAAAAEAIAEDAVQLRHDFAATREENAATAERLERELPSPTELAAQDCAQRRMELDALRRLEDDPTALDEAQRRTLHAEARGAAAALAERCPGAEQ